MKKEAYPAGFLGFEPPIEEANINKWQKIGKQVSLARRTYSSNTLEEIIDHFTKDWTLEERNRFSRWYEYTMRPTSYKQAQQGVGMQRFALDFNDPDQESRLLEVKKKARSRIKSIERLFDKMIDTRLLGDSKEAIEKQIYLKRLLQKLKEEIDVLRKPQLITARTQRASRLFKQAGILEVSKELDEITKSVFGEVASRDFIKRAEDNSRTLQRVLTKIKKEMDTFNYSVHLKILYSIFEDLEKLGYHSAAEQITELLKKDLADISKVGQKLTKIYTELSQIPMEVSSDDPEEEEVKPESTPKVDSTEPTTDAGPVNPEKVYTPIEQ